MTEREKQRIKELREAGKSYGYIASELNINLSTIRAHCLRYKLGGNRSSADISPQKQNSMKAGICENCGIKVKQQEKRKLKRFCSDACRMKWWSKHRDQVKHKTQHTFVCQNCGISFISYAATLTEARSGIQQINTGVSSGSATKSMRGSNAPRPG